jgi:hypothetical protein
MNILDENIIENQCQLLRSWRIKFHHKEFDTIDKRLGTIIRVTHSGITFWRLLEEKHFRFSRTD